VKAKKTWQFYPNLMDSLRGNIIIMTRLRSSRIGQESVALPWVHFFILSLLSLYQLTAFSILTASAIKSNPLLTEPGVEAQGLFAVLLLVYVLAISFAIDLNQPFSGAYQVRKSGTSAYLMGIRTKIEELRTPQT
jgi:hypothetical protein